MSERHSRSPPRVELSCVIPFFDEEENLEPLLDEVVPCLEDLGMPFEVLLVDDGSDDDGRRRALTRARRDPRLRVLALDRRRGQSAALVAGFRAAGGGIIVTMDADLQNDPTDVPRLLQQLGDADVVCGVRRGRRDSWVRRISSRIANAVRNRMTGESIRDVGCSLRVMRSPFLRHLPAFDGMHRFLPTLLRMQGARITEIDVAHRPRLRGKAKYGIHNRLWRGLADLRGVRWLQHRHLDLGGVSEVSVESGDRAADAR